MNFLRTLKNWWNRLFNRRKIEQQKDDEVLAKVEKLVIQKDMLRVIIQRDFKLKFGGWSRFFRRKGWDDAKIRTYIENKYGEQMKRVNLSLTHDLKLK